jgi:hypothetical protein
MQIQNCSTNIFYVDAIWPDGSSNTVALLPGSGVNCAGVGPVRDGFDGLYSGVVGADGNFVVIKELSPSAAILSGVAWGSGLAGILLAVIWTRRALTVRVVD